MTDNDQPRPDLDAAIDAVLPSLTTVSDEAAAASLRRTRIALAERAGTRRTLSPRWGFAAAAVAGAVVLVSASLWHRPAPDGHQATAPRPAAPTVPASPIPPASGATASAAPARVAGAAPAAPRPDRRSRPVRATSAPLAVVEPRPDPLIALVRAAQQIPDDTWAASVARAREPVTVPGLPLTSIVVVPLATPPILDTPAESVAPGEP